MLLVTKRCPHTGVMNFYSKDNPYVAVGSIARRTGADFAWRCYADGPELSGRAPDMATARERLTHYLDLAPLDDGRVDCRLDS